MARAAGGEQRGEGEQAGRHGDRADTVRTATVHATPTLDDG
ncbi:MAG: hypothetical protein ACLQU9_03420 [Acidimicrobiales bacterium]